MTQFAQVGISSYEWQTQTDASPREWGAEIGWTWLRLIDMAGRFPLLTLHAGRPSIRKCVCVCVPAPQAYPLGLAGKAHEPGQDQLLIPMEAVNSEGTRPTGTETKSRHAAQGGRRPSPPVPFLEHAQELAAGGPAAPHIQLSVSHRKTQLGIALCNFPAPAPFFKADAPLPHQQHSGPVYCDEVRRP